MSARSAEEVARIFLQCIADGEMRPDILADDFAFLSALTSGLDKDGLIDGVARTGQVCASPMRMIVHSVLAGPREVAVRAESKADLITGKHYNNHYHWYFKTNDQGQISITEEYCDTHHAREVLWPAFERLSA